MNPQNKPGSSLLSPTQSRRQTAGTRTEGERAFDRCLLPAGLYLLLVIVLFFLPTGSAPLTTEDSPPPALPTWLIWSLFGIGVALAVHWIWALRSFISAWRDPAAKVLRFSSLALLGWGALIICSLLKTPFHQ
jgi:hypothetical protein